jgi:caffeoyl-CoA O-methyltransferase
MPEKFTAMTPELHRYVVRYGARQDDLLERLAGETAGLGEVSRMEIAPEEGALLTLLAKSIGARHAIEVGTFTGYSSIAIARGLRTDGRLLTCDVNEEWTAIARRYWREAGLEGRIDLRLGPAVDTIRSLPEDEAFDFAFIDADKESYATYYEEILKRLRRGGLLVVDNVLWGGSVANPEKQGTSVRAIRALNEKIAEDRRVDVAMLPVSDGVTIVRKR